VGYSDLYTELDMRDFLKRFACLLLLCFPVLSWAAGLDDADERLFKVQSSMAQKGDPRAQYYLGEMYEQGLGTRSDLTQAFLWYDKAAQGGDALAKRKLTMRANIEAEDARHRAAEEASRQVKIAPPAPKNAAPKNVAGTVAKAKPAEDEAQIAARAAAEAARVAAAEKEKRRAMVRKMLADRMKQPAGALFD
jgi:TPR repeat protein